MSVFFFMFFRQATNQHSMPLFVALTIFAIWIKIEGLSCTSLVYPFFQKKKNLSLLEIPWFEDDV